MPTTATHTVKDLMQQLEAAGSEQTRKTWRRHGVSDECFGVKYADIYKLQKHIGIDHDLALALWKTGNHDARVLATMIADADKVAAAQLESWAKSANSKPAVDAIANFASKTKHALKSFETWTRSKDEWTAAAGWQLLACGVSSRSCGAPGEASATICDQPEAFFTAQLERIEKEIHTGQNRVRHAMNGALIAIGGRGGELQKQALAAAKRIGAVEVDHGETSCKTPDAESYIRKMAERNGATTSAMRPAVKKSPAATTTKKKASSSPRGK